jgi:hypothetical protein
VDGHGSRIVVTLPPSGGLRQEIVT